MAYELRNVHSNYVKIMALARHMAEAGVIDMQEERTPRVSYRFKLTSKGKRVAEKLKEAKELIGE